MFLVQIFPDIADVQPVFRPPQYRNRPQQGLVNPGRVGGSFGQMMQPAKGIWPGKAVFLPSVRHQQTAPSRESSCQLQLPAKHQAGDIVFFLIQTVQQIHQGPFDAADPQGFRHKQQFPLHPLRSFYLVFRYHYTSLSPNCPQATSKNSFLRYPTTIRKFPAQKIQNAPAGWQAHFRLSNK